MLTDPGIVPLSRNGSVWAHRRGDGDFFFSVEQDTFLHVDHPLWTMTNPIPMRGEVWRIRFDPAEGDEIRKIRTAVVISENAIGRLLSQSRNGNQDMRAILGLYA